MTERIKLTEDDIEMSPDTHAECCFSNHNYVLVINSKIPTGELFDYPQKLIELKAQILDDHEIVERLKEIEIFGLIQHEINRVMKEMSGDELTRSMSETRVTKLEKLYKFQSILGKQT